MKYEIFISYRRDGGDTLAQLIYDRLTARGYKVFLDIESLRSGKFNEKLLNVIEECKDLIVILPPGALERCSNEGDWLYLELSYAMKNRKNIIPVMMKGFEWPETFPEGLEGLQNYNGIHDSKDYFDAVIDKIVSLLQSRQTLFEILRKKGNKKTHVSLTRNRIRRAVFILIAVLLAAAGILFLPEKMRERELQKEAENVKAVFTPDEEMTITEFYDAQEIIKQRLDILSNGVDYDFTAREDQIEVSIPLDVFKDLDVEGTLEGEISRAMELYITGYLDEEGYLEPLSEREGEPITISREDIEKISVSQGNADAFGISEEDIETYRLGEAEEYIRVEIVLSEDICSSIQKVFGEQDVYCLGMDVGEYDRYYYWNLFKTKSEDTFYIINAGQNEGYNRLLQFNLQQETFSNGFTFNYTMPVEWGSLSEFTDPGEYQCNVWDIQEPYVTFQVDINEYYEIEEKEWQDVYASIKRRMDALNMPYAIGKTVNPDSEYGITIRTGTDHMGPEIIEMIFSNGGLRVGGIYSTLLYSNYVNDLTIESGKNGTYSFCPVSDELDSYSYESSIDAISSSDSSAVYLKVGTNSGELKIAKTDISEIAKERNPRFDNIYFLGMDKLTEENKYLLDLLKEIAVSPKFTPGYASYSLVSYIIKDNNGFNDWGIQSLADDILNSVKEQVGNLYPDAKVTASSYNCRSIIISMVMDLNDDFPQRVNEAVKQLYNICSLESGEIESLYMDIYTDYGGWIQISFAPSSYDPVIEYSGEARFVQEKLKRYGEKFRDIVLSDPFYTETVKSRAEGVDGWSFYFE